MSIDTDPAPGGGAGRIVTFYSYKGGTGRTMALANVAWILASRGFRVLAVDWDLEAPALHRYFRPFLEDDFARTTEGVIDLVRDCANAMLDEPSELDGPDWYLDYTRVEDYATRLQWDFGGGYLEIVSAGRQDEAYAQRVRSFDWRAFFKRLRGATLLRAVAEDMRANYDFVLIDSGAGISETAGLCTLTLPDTVVNCFRLNLQGIEGSAAAGESIARHREPAPIRMLPVPMCVDATDDRRVQPLRSLARFRFEGHPLGLDELQAEAYWAGVEVPYHPRYACEETLAVFGDPGGDEHAVLRAYERLAGVLSGGLVDRLAPIAEAERRHVLSAFEVGTSRAPFEVLIGYAAVDRMWAEWLQATLALAGVRATYREIGDHLEPQRAAEFKDGVDRASRLLLLLSDELVRSTSGIEAWKQGLAQEWGGRRRFLLPIRTGQIQLTDPFADRAPIEVIGRTWHDVRTSLFDALHIADPQPVAAITAEPSLAPRFPGDKPAVWNVPARSTTFIGRARLLEQLRNELSRQAGGVVPQALYGLGGVGKTHVAHEYANRFSADYDLVWWIPAEQPAEIPGHLERLANAIGIPSALPLQETVAEAIRALGEGRPTGRWLLIFDNAEEPDQVQPYIPAGTGHVLVTSRSPAWTDLGRPVRVGVFARPESIALLQRMVPALSTEDADRIAAKIGDLPLAVEQAAAYLLAESARGAAGSVQSVEEYLRLLDSEPQAALPTRREGGYPERAAAIWTVSLDRIRANDAAAAKLIELCSFFGPDRIPLSLLYGEVCVDILADYDPEIADLRDPTSVAPKVRELEKYALLQTDQADAGGQGVVYVHRLVQAVIRDHLRRDAWETNRAQVHRILAHVRPGNPDDSRSWDGYKEIIPHLGPSKAHLSRSAEVRRMVIDSAEYHHKRGDHDSCIRLADLAIEAWTRASGPDHLQVLLMRYNRSIALRAKGLYREAYDENQDVYQRLTEVAGPKHTYTLIAANGLGGHHRTFGHYAEARALDEKTVAVYKERFGDDDRGTLMAVNNLAVSLRLVGEFREAERLDKDTLERRRRVMPDHTYTLFSASNYGRDLRETGQFSQSYEVLKKALGDYRRTLGDAHADTLRTAKNLAVTLRKLGELAAARERTTWAWKTYQRTVPPDHLDYLACQLNLACDVSALDDDALAQRYAEEVLERYVSLLGPAHAFTLACRNNLGIFLRRQRDHVSARVMSEEVVAGLHETLGPQHPYVYAAELNLANDLFALGEIEAALELDQRTVGNLTRSLGQDHPDTLAASVNLSISRARAGDATGAAALLQPTLARMFETLGPGHPNVLQIRTDEAAPLAVQARFNCDIEPPPT
ncbi:FxSxx-COOH system tetratricopeptide repeat protein [Dactylosporangium salmoneum]|uniref:ATP/GTP-binding protein n=1 Tax=Dactylosporangium salmoneum TaxID=53361 RepID=A0ABN3FCV1_9ACTN